jgi:GDPmannose 4,6-dehydratase
VAADHELRRADQADGRRRPGPAPLKRALITGITGQDGSYLADLLLDRGYEVHGVVRDPAAPAERIAHVRDRLTLHRGDLLDQGSLAAALAAAQPTEVYNLAAASSVAASWKDPAATGEATGLGVARLLEALRATCPDARFLQAASNEIFGTVAFGRADETTPLAPRSPYGAAKAYAHHLVLGYREAYGLFGCCAILFNHESPRRGPEFVTRKITAAVAEIKLGRAEELRLGTLEPHRDWGFAGDYVDAMWRMLQRERPDNYVVATGVSHTVRDCVELAFAHVGLDWEQYVKVDAAFARPSEAKPLVGDAGKAARDLGWTPRTTFEQTIGMMVDHDLALLRGEGRS